MGRAIRGMVVSSLTLWLASACVHHPVVTTGEHVATQTAESTGEGEVSEGQTTYRVSNR